MCTRYALNKVTLCCFPTTPVHSLAGGQHVFVVIYKWCVSLRKQVSKFIISCLAMFQLFPLPFLSCRHVTSLMVHVWYYNSRWFFLFFVFFPPELPFTLLFFSPRLCRSKSDSYFFLYFFKFVSFSLFLPFLFL